MAAEIERKFLVKDDTWKQRADTGKAIVQAYVATTGRASVRVRIVDDAQAYLTVKSAEPGAGRSEFEYAIPVEDARELARLRAGRVIEKRRHRVPAGELCWEVDVFAGDHAGLVIAEIELPHAETEFERPDWLGREVTEDRRYYNSSLAMDPLASS